ncbi:MAG: 2-oxo acid dehydrogenase subunit E2, partial [Pseudomonadota bacterium]
MSKEIKAPTFPESIADGAILTWYKQPGEAVERDETLVDIETDKVVIEVVAPADGTLDNIIKQEGDTVLSEEVVATFKEGAQVSAAPAEEASSADVSVTVETVSNDAKVNPAAKKISEEKGVDLSSIQGSGKDGRVTKGDVLRAPVAPVAASGSTDAALGVDLDGHRVEKRVPMTRLRAKIAERLLSVTQETAMLTTFNEVNMAPVMDLRNKYKAEFEKAHDGTRLGFMSFFVRAAVEALKRFPAVNASIDGNDVVYHSYQDVGIAVSSDRGLVVPVLRDVDLMGLAD